MYSEINPYIEKLAELSDNSNSISPDMYKEHKVFRGLRDLMKKYGQTVQAGVPFLPSTSLSVSSLGRFCRSELCSTGRRYVSSSLKAKADTGT